MKVLKFGAVWCSGCLVMRPRWKEIVSELPWFKADSPKPNATNVNRED